MAESHVDLSKFGLHPKTIKWILTYCNVVIDPSISSLFTVCFEKDFDGIRYRIALSPTVLKLTELSRRYIILHAVAHLLHGDLLQERNDSLISIAQDCRINEHFKSNRDVLEFELSVVLPDKEGPVLPWYDVVCKDAIASGDLPNYCVSWTKIYYWLRKQFPYSTFKLSAGESSGGSGSEEGSQDSPDDSSSSKDKKSESSSNDINEVDSQDGLSEESSSSEDEKSGSSTEVADDTASQDKQLQLLLRYSKLFNDISQDIDHTGNGISVKEKEQLQADILLDGKCRGITDSILQVSPGVRAGKNIQSKKATFAPEKLRVPVIDKILRIIKFKFFTGIKRIKHTYNVPGFCKGLKGSQFKRFYKIAVGVDVSGSYYHRLPLAAGLAVTLNKEYEADCFAWADSCEKFYPATGNLPAVGYGTDVNSFLSKVKKYDIVICITDAFFYDPPQYKDVPPVIYVVPKSSPAPNMRSIDFLVPVSEL